MHVIYHLNSLVSELQVQVSLGFLLYLLDELGDELGLQGNVEDTGVLAPHLDDHHVVLARGEAHLGYHVKFQFPNDGRHQLPFFRS